MLPLQVVAKGGLARLHASILICVRWHLSHFLPMARTVAMVFFFVAAGQLAVAVAKAAGDDPSSPLHVGTLASIDAMAPSVFDIFDSLQGRPPASCFMFILESLLPSSDQYPPSSRRRASWPIRCLRW